MRSLRSVFFAALLSISVCSGGPVFALSEQQLLEKLKFVPIFTIVDQKGNPLLLSVKSQKDVGFLNFYLDADLAQQTMKAFQAQNPQQAKNYRIGVINLSQAYQAAITERKKNNTKVRFQFLSSSKDVQTATELAKKQDPKFKDNFAGVPVFFVVGGEKKGILTINKDGKEILPMFFSEADLQNDLNQLRLRRNDLPKSLSVQVATLDSVVGTMLSGKNDADSAKITFFPSRSALTYVQTLVKNAPKPAAKKP
jgi:hypothetical protein